MKRKIGAAVLVLVIIILSLVFLSKAFTINSIQCTSEGSCDGEVVGLLESQKGKNYFAAKKSLGDSLSSHPKVESYEIHFAVPSTLSLSLIQKKEAFGLKFAQNRYLLFDEDASLIGESESTDLPYATVLGVPLDNELVFGVKLMLELVKYYGAENMRVDKNGFYAVLPNRGEVTFPLSGDVDVVLGSLEAVLSQLNRSPQNHTITIDLRYKNPVVYGI